MNSLADLKPNWISSPGQTISDILREREIEINEFQKQMNCSLYFINNLLAGKETITMDIAQQLENILGSSKSFWIRRENQYRDYLNEFNNVLNTYWINSLPYDEMIKLGWIIPSSNKFKDCLEYFNVSSVDEWNKKFQGVIQNVNFRTSKSFNSTLGSTAAWIRRGEILSEKVNCDSWNPDLFEKTLYEIKPLTRKKEPEVFLPILIKLCAKCGIVLSILPTPSECKASGASKFMTNDRALIIMSFRHMSDDQFWFTFFHEAGHLLLHGFQKIFIEEDKNSEDKNFEEIEANLFAGEFLVPNRFHTKLSEIKGNKRKIISLALEAGVSPGIIVGQMQYHKIISNKYMNGYKRYYNWNDINLALSNL